MTGYLPLALVLGFLLMLVVFIVSMCKAAARGDRRFR